MRAAAGVNACDIHPLNNTAALNYLKSELGHRQGEIDAWYAHWVAHAIETMIRPGPFAFGAQVTLADVCLVPQVYNARRFKVSLDRFSKIAGVDAECLRLAAFDRARPENQPDAE